ncbi:MAG: hypothetical protein H6635_12595 [Anaerolineales bacterium]|nr:hypothetical protein [Anaerolineales bacterium]MCB9146208.1 hypothetical protein [Anaerolineales bacterium]
MKKSRVIVFCITCLFLFACNAGLEPTALPTSPVSLDASKVYIEGKLRWGGALGNVPVELYVIESSEVYASVTTNADGSFSFPALDPITPGFAFNIAVPVSNWKCSQPVPLGQTWFKSARAFQVAENQVNISMISDAEKEIRTGEIILINIDLQCP